MDIRRNLIVVGLLLVAAGVFWPWISRVGLGRLPGDIAIDRPGLGRLPGDIAIDRPGLHVNVPIVSWLLISVVLTLLFWFIRK